MPTRYDDSFIQDMFYPKCEVDMRKDINAFRDESDRLAKIMDCLNNSKNRKKRIAIYSPTNDLAGIEIGDMMKNENIVKFLKIHCNPPEKFYPTKNKYYPVKANHGVMLWGDKKFVKEWHHYIPDEHMFEEHNPKCEAYFNPCEDNRPEMGKYDKRFNMIYTKEKDWYEAYRKLYGNMCMLISPKVVEGPKEVLPMWCWIEKDECEKNNTPPLVKRARL